MNILLISTILLFGLFSFSHETPLKCTSISTEYVYKYDKGSIYQNYTGSSDMKVYSRDNVKYVSIQNVKVIDYAENLKADQICYGKKCTNDLTKPFEMQIENSTFQILANFTTAITPNENTMFVNGIVDEESFYSFDGKIYTPKNNCSTKTLNYPDLISYETHCCTAFAPVPQAASNTPRCKKFQSRTSILNVDDNYSIFATSKVIFTLSKNNSLTGEGNFTGPNYYEIEYFLNKNGKLCGGPYENSKLKCSNMSLPENSDSRAMIWVRFINTGGENGDGRPGMIGRIVIRDGQTLMKEGIPFTPKNNCLYNNYSYGGKIQNQIVSNQFCCTEFEDNFGRNNPEHQFRNHLNLLHHSHLNRKNSKYSKFESKKLHV